MEEEEAVNCRSGCQSMRGIRNISELYIDLFTTYLLKRTYLNCLSKDVDKEKEQNLYAPAPDAGEEVVEASLSD